MPARVKEAIFVWTIKRGTSKPRKVVLGTLGELNDHLPQEDITKHLKEPTKPWKKERPPHRAWRSTRRNAGRDEGKTWGNKRFVCGPVLKPGWKTDLDNACGDETDDQEGMDVWESKTDRMLEKESLMEDLSNKAPRDEHREVSIMDIAKPAKSKSLSKGYEVVTIREVIALDDIEWDWGDESEDMEDWETVEDEATALRQTSYAMVAKHMRHM